MHNNKHLEYIVIAFCRGFKSYINYLRTEILLPELVANADEDLQWHLPKNSLNRFFDLNHWLRADIFLPYCLIPFFYIYIMARLTDLLLKKEYLKLKTYIICVNISSIRKASILVFLKSMFNGLDASDRITLFIFISLFSWSSLNQSLPFSSLLFLFWLAHNSSLIFPSLNYITSKLLIIINQHRHVSE